MYTYKYKFSAPTGNGIKKKLVLELAPLNVARLNPPTT